MGDGRSKPKDAATDHALTLVLQVCRLAGSFDLIDANRTALQRQGVTKALRQHDTPVLFDWLMTMVSYQGIADAVADRYMRDHGNISWAAIRRDLKTKPACPKLAGYWAFAGCRYVKTSCTCSQPQHLTACPLPRYDLRNGRLNQTAQSLYFFIRDVAGGNLVQWIDDTIAAAGTGPDWPDVARDELIEGLRGVYGISDKVISMVLASLLLAAPRAKARWRDVGARFVVVDTLVHNFLHRTGILSGFKADHAFGAACYRPNGCASLIAQVAERIDAQAFNAAYPTIFPRFVVFSLWRYCSAGGLDICNGNRIDDGARCNNIYCQLRSRCKRLALPKPLKKQQKQLLDS
jgi:hypothetical protein